MAGSNKADVAAFDKDTGIMLGYVSDAAKVWLSGVSNTAAIPIELGSANDVVVWAKTNLTTTTNRTASIVAAPGASTAIQLRGFSVANLGTVKCTIELRWGTTAFFRSALPASSGGGGLMNWNLIGQYAQATNKKLVIFHSGNTTTVWTVSYKAV